MDLPTYTSIWRIEKRLYKLYDFRLPMPLPIGQLSVFAAIAVPYVLLLTVLSVPFNHTLIWLYVLPPGVATWLATRPVLEGKRLPELIRSQLRYLAEPRIWCRMAPLAERDVVMVTGKIWRFPRGGRRSGGPDWSDGPAAGQDPDQPVSARRYDWGPPPVQLSPPGRWPNPRTAPMPAPAPALAPAPAPASAPEPTRRPTITVVHAGEQAPPAVERALASPSGLRGDIRSGRVSVVPGGQRPGKPDQLQRDRARARQPLGRPRRIVVLGCTVGAGQTVTTLVTGEVLASLRSDEVAVLDLNPGTAGLSQRAQVRPALSQAASLSHSRLVVLESGQRPLADDLDGYDDPDGIDGRDDYGAEDSDPAAYARAFADASARYQLVLADPSTGSVPRLLALTDLLVLVAPASVAAVSAIGMTFEWLDAHGQAGLAAESIMVLNGVSRRSAAHVEQAERVCAGRCHAIVRVPWDETLKDRQAKRAVHLAPGSPALQRWAGLLSPATAGAYTALAGLIVSVLAEAPGRAPAQSRGAGR